MRPLMACSLYLWAEIGSLHAQNHAPVVSNVHAEQRPGTALVDITYDVADADDDSLIVIAVVSRDSGRTFGIVPSTEWGLMEGVTTATLSGNVGFGVAPGPGKRITWDAGEDHWAQSGMGYQVKVVAHDAPAVNDGYGDYMVVPAGAFQMGNNWSQLDPSVLHTVFLTAYYIGKYEVTNGEYKRFINDAGYATRTWWEAGGFGQYGTQPLYWDSTTYRGGGIDFNEEFPVTGVSWYEATAYCAWLSAKTRQRYRLTTEAEWEKAGRGTDLRRYPWGGYSVQYLNDTLSSLANYLNSGDPFDNGVTPAGFYDGGTNRGFATRSNASPYGAYDMAGNVREWCSDWFARDYYISSSRSDPPGAINGTSRVVRDQMWTAAKTSITLMVRGLSSPSFRRYDLGFRVVRAP